MSWEGFTAVFQPLTLVYTMLSVALVLAFVRLARGPSLPDRVVALDLISVITVGTIAAYAIDVDQRVFLDAAIVVALIAFLGTVAFAQYVERRARDD
jgi:multicomponent Na+:H+ antiporter subunit F